MTYAAVAANNSALLAVDSVLTAKAKRIVHMVIRPNRCAGSVKKYNDMIAPTIKIPAMTTLNVPTALVMRVSGR